MAAKYIKVLCAQVLLIQSVFSQCFRPYSGLPPYGWAGRYGYEAFGYAPWARWGYAGYEPLPPRGYGYSPLATTNTNGGSLIVTSSSAIPPTGLKIVSDTIYEGILCVSGEVPFVGTTAMEGALPTAGAGAIKYGCGNGFTAMLSEVAPGIIAPVLSPVIAPAVAPVLSPTIGYDGYDSRFLLTDVYDYGLLGRSGYECDSV